MNQLSSGTSIQSYNFVSDWIIFDNNMIQILTGKIDIGQHISTTLALIVSRELDININKVEVANNFVGKSTDRQSIFGTILNS